MTETNLASQAFDDLFTNNFGNSYFVSVEPQFEEQITEAVNLISRSRPENVRQSYINQFITAAKLASPPQVVPEQEEDEEVIEEEKKELTPETEELKELKRKVIKDLIFSIKNLKFDNFLSFNNLNLNLESFLNLLLNLILNNFSPIKHEGDYTNLLLVLVDNIIFNATTSTLTSTTSSLESNSTISNLTRFNSITILFNSLPLTPNQTDLKLISPNDSLNSLKLTILIKLLNLILKNEEFEFENFKIIIKTLNNLPNYFNSWGYSLNQSGSEEGNLAILSLSTLLIEKDQKILAKELILNHLTNNNSTITTTTSHSLSQLISQLIILSLQIESVFNFSSLSTIPSISSPSIPSLYTLLQIFQSGSLSSFQSFLSSPENITMLSQNGLIIKSLEKKLKLISLAELSSSRIGQFLSYQEIAEALDLKVGIEDDGEIVEGWVIDAIRSSLLTGKLSQPTKSLFITRAVPRSFTSENWNLLELNLKEWKSSLENILVSVKSGLKIDDGKGSIGGVEVMNGMTKEVSA